MIPQSAIEEVKARNDIADVVSSYVTLGKRSGSNIFGLCPFHREKTPSFSVSVSKQIFHCFGCGKGGDVITFIMEIEKLGYVEAIHRLADRVGYALPENEDPRERQRAQNRKRLLALTIEAARFFYRTLQGSEGAACRDYLSKRGLGREIQVQFGLGYAPDAWQGLYDHVKREGYTENECRRSGLFKVNRNGGTYDLFRGRLMFPIIDVTGQVIAFGGRVLDDSLPKYINSPETEIYHKGRQVFGLNIAKKSSAPHFLIVEGYMDVLALHQGGIDEAIAVLGTALTGDQVRLLKRYKDQLILSLDSDRAGQAATERSLDVIRDKGATAKVLKIPDAKDPDQYVKEFGPERFRGLIHDALSRIDYQMALARDGALTDSGDLDPIIYQGLAIDVLADIDNSVVRELYISRVAETLGIGIDSVRMELTKALQRPKKQTFTQAQGSAPRAFDSEDHEGFGSPPMDAPPESDDRAAGDRGPTALHLTRDQLYFLVGLADQSELYDALRNDIDASWFRGAEGQAFVAEVFECADEETLSTSRLLELGAPYVIGDRPLRDVIVDVSFKLPEHLSDEQRQSMLQRLALQIHIDDLKDQRQKVARRLGQPGLDEAERTQLREQLRTLTIDLNRAQTRLQNQTN